ncbi:MAG TPA: HAD family hydrolase [Polyangiales bacterium]
MHPALPRHPAVAGDRGAAVGQATARPGARCSQLACVTTALGRPNRRRSGGRPNGVARSRASSAVAQAPQTTGPAGRSAVARHRAQGDVLAIVTGSTPYAARPLARELGIEHVVAAVNPDARLQRVARRRGRRIQTW